MNAASETINAVLTAVISGGLTAFFAKLYISKTIKDLETVLEKVSQIRNELTRLTVKLEYFEKAADLVMKHDTQIAAIEAKLYGSQRTGRAPHPPA